MQRRKQLTDPAQISMPLEAPSGRDLRDRGIARAEEHAETLYEAWNNKAFKALESYLVEVFPARVGGPFTCEEFRAWCQGNRQELAEPPSLRAFGGIILRAAKKGLIHKIGYIKVKNPRAHMATAMMWAKT